MGWRDRTEWADDDEDADAADDDAAADDREAPDESDVNENDDDDETVPCPYCRKPVYEGAELCPHCRKYLSDEDAPRRRSPLIWTGVILAILGLAGGLLFWLVGRVF
jgi:predicted nucleic acid-binding Zn ribbon protein